MEFLLTLKKYNTDIREIEFEVISEDDTLYDIVYENFDELYTYDLSWQWKEPYEPITFNMIVESGIDKDGEGEVIIYSDGVRE